MKNIKKILKLFTIFLFSFTFFSCSQEELSKKNHVSKTSDFKVSLELARTVALNFSSDDAFIRDSIDQNLNVKLRSNRTKSKAFPGFEEREIQEVVPFMGKNGQIALYVIKFSPNGYIIVPSTKKEIPILAFSNDGIFDQSNMPPGILAWLETRTEIVHELENDENYDVPAETTNQWLAVAPPIDEEEIVSGGKVSEQVGPLLSTRWVQGHG